MTLQQLLYGGITLNEAEWYWRQGVISQATYDRYVFLWRWSACRHGAEHGAAHDRAYRKLGSELYWRRIDRVAQWVRDLKRQAFEAAYR